jgi:hypothetical protein
MVDDQCRRQGFIKASDMWANFIPLCTPPPVDVEPQESARHLRRDPTIFRHVAELAARQYQLAPAVFSLAAEQWMIREKLESPPNAKHPFTRKLWVVIRKQAE